MNDAAAESSSPACEAVMLCVQPIAYRESAFLTTLCRNIDIAALHARPAPGARPDWLNVEGISRRHLSALHVVDRIGAREQGDLAADMEGWGATRPLGALARALDAERSTCWLLFDARFNYFVILTELVFRFDDAAALRTAFLPGGAEEERAYCELRAMLVAEEEGTPLCAWAEAVRARALDQIQAVLAACMREPPARDDLVVPPSTGNISFFFEGLAGAPARDEIAAGLFRASAAGERHSTAVEPFKVADGSSYLFGGRFHTIVLGESGRAARYKQIQLHMQYMWFFLLRVYAAIERVAETLVDSGAKRAARRLDALIAPLIMRLELLVAFNEGFKVSIANEAESVYKRVQSQWNVEGALHGVTKFTVFLKNHLAELEERRRERSARRTNAALIFISVMQVFGLVSVWADYLGLLGGGGPENLRLFNASLPVALTALVLGVSAILLVLARRDR